MLRAIFPGQQPQGPSRTLPYGVACLLAFFVLLLAGCAQPQLRPAHSHDTLWAGRLALQVEDQASQSFSASF